MLMKILLEAIQLLKYKQSKYLFKRIYNRYMIYKYKRKIKKNFVLDYASLLDFFTVCNSIHCNHFINNELDSVISFKNTNSFSIIIHNSDIDMKIYVLSSKKPIIQIREALIKEDKVYEYGINLDDLDIKEEKLKTKLFLQQWVIDIMCTIIDEL